MIVNSQATANHLPYRGKVAVVYNGIEVERFDPAQDGAPFRGQHGIPREAPVAGIVGRLRPWKGQDRFLRMAAEVVRAVPEAHFLVVGGEIFGVEDEYAAELRTLAADLGLAGRVTFTEQVDDVRPALAAMDVFVHAGDPEPFGLVNIEAMAMARPVVAFSHGALPEIVRAGETGILVAPGDEAVLAERVIILLRDREMRRVMGQAGRARVAKEITAQPIAAQVGEILLD